MITDRSSKESTYRKGYVPGYPLENQALVRNSYLASELEGPSPRIAPIPLPCLMTESRGFKPISILRAGPTLKYFRVLSRTRSWKDVGNPFVLRGSVPGCGFFRMMG